MHTLRLAGLAVSVLLLRLYVGTSAAAPQSAPVQPVTEGTCLTCHDRAGDTRLQSHHQACLSCHLGGDTHVSEPQAGNIGRPAAAQCLTCHGAAMRGAWSFGDHAKADVACSSCHEMHPKREVAGLANRNRQLDRVSATCAGCHADVMARFRLPSRHPVSEGAMSCTSCHDPHAADRTALASEVDRCGKCHPSQRAPKPIVHPPVAEACSNCHTPHGSPNRRLLTLAQPALCIQCHSVADNRHAVNAAARGALSGAAMRGCVNCHKAIHGGQMDPHLRY